MVLVLRDVVGLGCMAEGMPLACTLGRVAVPVAVPVVWWWRPSGEPGAEPALLGPAGRAYDEVVDRSPSS